MLVCTHFYLARLQIVHPFLRIQHTACHGNWKASVVASTQVGSRAAVAVTCLPWKCLSTSSHIEHRAEHVWSGLKWPVLGKLRLLRSAELLWGQLRFHNVLQYDSSVWTMIIHDTDWYSELSRLPTPTCDSSNQTFQPSQARARPDPLDLHTGTHNAETQQRDIDMKILQSAQIIMSKQYQAQGPFAQWPSQGHQNTKRHRSLAVFRAYCARTHVTGLGMAALERRSEVSGRIWNVITKILC